MALRLGVKNVIKWFTNVAMLCNDGHNSVAYMIEIHFDVFTPNCDFKVILMPYHDK